MDQSLFSEPKHAPQGVSTARRVLQFSKILGISALLFSAALALAYGVDSSIGLSSESRLFSDGTLVLCLALLSAGALNSKPYARLGRYRAVPFLIVLVVSGFDLAMALMPSSASQDFSVHSLSFAALAFLSAGALLRVKYANFALLATLGGCFAISLEVLGWLAGPNAALPKSTLSIILCLTILSAAFLTQYIRSPLLRPLIFDTAWSRIARVQIAAVVGCMVFIGLFSAKFGATGSLMLAIVSSSWLFIFVILASGPIFEKAERQRRAMERLLRHQAHRDPLTGLFNRRALLGVELMPSSKSIGAPAVRSVGVILADVDRFKKINDTVGHDGGDLVLRNIASLIRAKVGPEDVVIRWGGEEFLILLPGAALERTMSVAHLIRAEVAMGVEYGVGTEKMPVTLSVGVAQFKGALDQRPLDVVIQDADAALYKAKSTGRNKVETLELVSSRKSLSPKDFLPKADELH